MKLKYFMRGLGAGILMAALVLLLTNPVLMDDEIIERAKELGMSYESASEEIEEDSILDNIKKAEDEVEKETIEDVSTDLQEENQEVTQEDSSEGIQENIDDEEQQTEDSDSMESIQHIEIVVTKGMHSLAVSQRLYENGLIEDTKDFDSFLIHHGYQYSIQDGVYSLSSEMSYQEIAEAITK